MPAPASRTLTLASHLRRCFLLVRVKHRRVLPSCAAHRMEIVDRSQCFNVNNRLRCWDYRTSRRNKDFFALFKVTDSIDFSELSQMSSILIQSFSSVLETMTQLQPRLFMINHLTFLPEVSEKTFRNCIKLSMWFAWREQTFSHLTLKTMKTNTVE